MNREIKFRVWNGAEMVYDVVVGKHGAFYALIDPKDTASLVSTTIYYEQTPVMQYTGLKNKNEVEIYEGDIVRFTSPRGHTKRTHRAFNDMQVVWGAGTPKRQTGWYLFWDSNYQRVESVLDENHEVIGNIYESPELLETNHAI